MPKNRRSLPNLPLAIGDVGHFEGAGAAHDEVDESLLGIEIGGGVDFNEYIKSVNDFVKSLKGIVVGAQFRRSESINKGIPALENIIKKYEIFSGILTLLNTSNLHIEQKFDDLGVEDGDIVVFANAIGSFFEIDEVDNRDLIKAFVENCIQGGEFLGGLEKNDAILKFIIKVNDSLRSEHVTLINGLVSLTAANEIKLKSALAEREAEVEKYKKVAQGEQKRVIDTEVRAGAAAGRAERVAVEQASEHMRQTAMNAAKTTAEVAEEYDTRLHELESEHQRRLFEQEASMAQWADSFWQEYEGGDSEDFLKLRPTAEDLGVLPEEEVGAGVDHSISTSLVEGGSIVESGGKKYVKLTGYLRAYAEGAVPSSPGEIDLSAQWRQMPKPGELMKKNLAAISEAMKNSKKFSEERKRQLEELDEEIRRHQAELDAIARKRIDEVTKLKLELQEATRKRDEFEALNEILRRQADTEFSSMKSEYDQRLKSAFAEKDAEHAKKILQMELALKESRLKIAQLKAQVNVQGLDIGDSHRDGSPDLDAQAEELRREIQGKMLELKTAQIEGDAAEVIRGIEGTYTELLELDAKKIGQLEGFLAERDARIAALTDDNNAIAVELDEARREAAKTGSDLRSSRLQLSSSLQALEGREASENGEILDLKGQIERLKSEHKRAVASLRVEIEAEKQAEIDNLRTNLAKLQTDLQRKGNISPSELTRLQGEKEELTRKVADLEVSYEENLNRAVEEVEAELRAHFEAGIAEVESDYEAKLRSKQSAFDAQTAELEERYEVELARQRNEVFEQAETKVSELKSKVVELTTELMEEKESKRHSLNLSDSVAHDAQSSSLEVSLRETKAQLTEVEREMARLVEEHDEVKQALTAVREELAARDAVIADQRAAVESANLAAQQAATARDTEVARVKESNVLEVKARHLALEEKRAAEERLAQVRVDLEKERRVKLEAETARDQEAAAKEEAQRALEQAEVDHEAQLEELTATNNDLQAARDVALARANGLQQRIDKVLAEKGDEEAVVNALRGELAQAKAEVEAARGAAEVAAGLARQAKAAHDDELAAARGGLELAAALARKAEAETVAARGELEKVRGVARVNEAFAQQERTRLEAGIAALQEAAEAARGGLDDDKEAELADLRAKLARLPGLEEDILAVRGRLEEVETERNEARAETENRESRIGLLQEENSRLTGVYQAQQEELERLKKLGREANANYEAQLKGMMEAHEEELALKDGEIEEVEAARGAAEVAAGLARQAKAAHDDELAAARGGLELAAALARKAEAETVAARGELEKVRGVARVNEAFAQQERTRLEAGIAALQEAAEAARGGLDDDKEAELADLRAKLARLPGLEEDILAVRGRLEEVETERNEARAETENRESRIGLLQEENSRLTGVYQAQQEELERLKKLGREANANYEAQLKGMMEAHEEELALKDGEIEGVEAKRDEALALQENTLQALQRSEDVRGELAQENARLRDDNDRLRAELTAALNAAKEGAGKDKGSRTTGGTLDAGTSTPPASPKKKKAADLKLTTAIGGGSFDEEDLETDMSDGESSEIESTTTGSETSSEFSDDSEVEFVINPDAVIERAAAIMYKSARAGDDEGDVEEFKRKNNYYPGHVTRFKGNDAAKADHSENIAKNERNAMLRAFNKFDPDAKPSQKDCMAVIRLAQAAIEDGGKFKDINLFNYRGLMEENFPSRYEGQDNLVKVAKDAKEFLEGVVGLGDLKKVIKEKLNPTTSPREATIGDSRASSPFRE